MSRFYNQTSDLIPKSKYIFNNYEPQYTESAEQKVIERASAMKFGSTKPQDSKGSGAPIEINIADFKPSFSMSDRPSGSTELEFFDDLNDFGAENEAKDEAMLKKLSDSTFDMYKVFSSSTVIGSTVISATSRMSQSNKVMVFEQEGFDPDQSEKTNFIYMLGLPYDLTTKSNLNLKYEIQEALAHIGEVKSMKLFSYKDFCSILKIQNKLLIPKNLNDYFNVPFTDVSSLQRKDQSAIARTEEHFQTDSLDIIPAEERSMDIDEPSFYSNRQNSIRISLPSKENRRLFKTSARIMSSIDLAQWNRLRKSYAIIEVNDYETKQKFLSTDLRCFGILISGNQCIIEDADFKRSLIIANIPYGEDSHQFVSSLNSILEVEGVKIAMPSEKAEIMCRTRAIVRFKTFGELLRCQALIHDSEMGQDLLKAHVLHANLKCFQGKFTELVDFSDEKAHELRLLELKDQELKYIQQIEASGGFLNASEAEAIREKSTAAKKLEETTEVERQTLLDFEKAIQFIQKEETRTTGDYDSLEESIVEELERSESDEELLENTQKY